MNHVHQNNKVQLPHIQNQNKFKDKVVTPEERLSHHQKAGRLLQSKIFHDANKKESQITLNEEIQAMERQLQLEP